MEMMDIPKLYTIDGGIRAWIAAGLPVDHSPL
jgi:3-mercaptopyruvate sulfurtransferase SseA